MSVGKNIKLHGTLYTPVQQPRPPPRLPRPPGPPDRRATPLHPRTRGQPGHHHHPLDHHHHHRHAFHHLHWTSHFIIHTPYDNIPSIREIIIRELQIWTIDKDFNSIYALQVNGIRFFKGFIMKYLAFLKLVVLYFTPPCKKNIRFLLIMNKNV